MRSFALVGALRRLVVRRRYPHLREQQFKKHHDFHVFGELQHVKLRVALHGGEVAVIQLPLDQPLLHIREYSPWRQGINLETRAALTGKCSHSRKQRDNHRIHFAFIFRSYIS